MNKINHFPIKVIFREAHQSTPAIQASIYKHAEKLGHYFNQILHCCVTINAPQHQYRGNIFQISVQLKVPGHELVVSRNPSACHEHEDIYVAIRDAFTALTKQLQTYSKKLKGKVKAHCLPENGKWNGHGKTHRDDAFELEEVWLWQNQVKNGKQREKR